MTGTRCVRTGHIDRTWSLFQAGLEEGGWLGGIPQTAGTKEYLTCVKGTLAVSVLGTHYPLTEGNVLAFPGDHPHAYHNTVDRKAVGFNVIVLAPRMR